MGSHTEIYGAGVSIGVYGIPDWGLWGPTLRSMGLGSPIGVYGLSIGIYGGWRLHWGLWGWGLHWGLWGLQWGLWGPTLRSMGLGSPLVSMGFPLGSMGCLIGVYGVPH